MPSTDQDAIAKSTPWKAAIAASIGSAIEFYDFCIFGTASALIFGRVFFPNVHATTGLLLSFGTLAVGYLARPVGALCVGHFGDKYGRKRVLVLTLATMGVSTFLLGCLPSNDQVGEAAPVLLLLLRLSQGLAASGEQAAACGMSIEHAPQKRRAFFSSFTASGSHAGAVLAMLVYMPILTLPDDALFEWGWRVPFWIGSAVAVVGYFIRRNLTETPVFEEARQEGKIVRMPLLLLFRCYRVDVLRVVCSALMATIGVIFTVYGLSYAVNVAKFEKQTMILIMALGGVLGVVSVPLWAALADRIGRKPVFFTSAIATPICLIGYFFSIDAHNLPLVFTFCLVGYGVAYCAFNGIWAALCSEMFDARVRLSGMGIGTQLGFGLSGTAPMLAVAIGGQSAQTWLPGVGLAIGACIVASIAVYTTRETYDIDIRSCGRPDVMADVTADVMANVSDEATDTTK